MIFLSTGYEKYGVLRAPYSKGTEISTEYGDFSEHGVRGVRSTKSTKVRASIPEYMSLESFDCCAFLAF